VMALTYSTAGVWGRKITSFALLNVKPTVGFTFNRVISLLHIGTAGVARLRSG